MGERAPLQAAVLAWYDATRRPLPWRRTRDPYAILVVEVMAQQTQIARVLERYEGWLERWPTAAALAAATPAEVLTEWSGLGYNRRALRLREACAIVTRDGWPRDSAGLRTLPGIGPYTAAAVASFAFGERIAAVDTNVRRVAMRLAVAPGALLPAERHSDWNQAAMELGARVCTARSPRCAECPAASWCPSRGRVAALPSRLGARTPFRETDRWLRGRIVAALAAGGDLPDAIAADRLERVLAGLERDGLVERGPNGLELPGARC
ncbi:MAG TPA: A/G-specific adenine glycosylase [Solirubrobacteraceae bacterium]|jgi:A/G-specific adenine glycosylase|nr:A/G-specific adenine glycosylase [Solirubrobacteraceae bacterium]